MAPHPRDGRHQPGRPPGVAAREDRLRCDQGDGQAQKHNRRSPNHPWNFWKTVRRLNGSIHSHDSECQKRTRVRRSSTEAALQIVLPELCRADCLPRLQREHGIASHSQCSRHSPPPVLRDWSSRGIGALCDTFHEGSLCLFESAFFADDIIWIVFGQQCLHVQRVQEFKDGE